MGTRRVFSREYKLEAVKLVRDRGVAVAQAARDLGLHENVLRKWVREQRSDPQQAFPGHGQMKPEAAELDRLRKEVQKLRTERDILKNPRPGLSRVLSVEKHRRRVGVRQDCDRQLFGGLSTPSKNLVQGTLRIDLWRRLWRPRLGN